MAEQSTYQRFFEYAPDAMLVMHGDRFVDCNPAAVQMLRFPNREALLRRFSGMDDPEGRPAHPADLSPPFQPDGTDSYEKADECLRIAFERGMHTFEWLHLCGDGSPLLVEVQLTVVERGDTPTVHVVWRDIRERKRLEAEQHRSQRLEAIGRFAGGIAHDFNNVLTVIMACTSELAMQPSPERLEQISSNIAAASERAAQMTAQLLAFSRGQPIQKRPLNLSQRLSELRPFLAQLVGASIEVNFVATEDSLTISADSSQIDQVLMNLAANARDAMPKGGRIEITLDRVSASTESPTAELSSGEYVRLTLSDTGVGMSQEQLERAFDPFFTTKEVGKGTGLGLATVQAIATQNGGHMTMTSEPSQGTTACVYFPECDQPVPSAVTAAVPSAVPAKTGDRCGSTLLVDDEEALREVFAKALRELGYTIETAGSGKQALELLSAAPESFDVLVTDIAMPGMTGPELAAAARQIRPDLGVIFFSGYLPDSLALQLDGETPVLQKPLSPARLDAEIRRLRLERDSC